MPIRPDGARAGGSAGPDRMGQRRRARELAFLSLYQCELLGGSAASRLADLLADQSRPPEVAEFAGLVVESFDRHRAAVDRMIRETSPKWELERMASTDRAVLRLAVTEMLLVPGVPEPVVVGPLPVIFLSR